MKNKLPSVNNQTKICIICEGNEEYEVVMNYYKERNPEQAKEVAEQALEKCKVNQTPFMIYLMDEARTAGDEVRFQKLNLSAHRRRAVDAKKVDEYFS